MTWNNDRDDVAFFEPILAKKDCQLRIDFAEPAIWEVKLKDKWSSQGASQMGPYIGKKYQAMGISLTIIDYDVKTEHEGAQIRRAITHQINLEKYPFWNEKKGEVGWMGKQQLYDLEKAMGFDPAFMVGSERVEPVTTKAGNKVAPKAEGVKQIINPDFFSAYFNSDGTVNPTNWINKVVFADVDVEKSEQYGDKNVVVRFKKVPVTA